MSSSTFVLVDGAVVKIRRQDEDFFHWDASYNIRTSYGMGWLGAEEGDAWGDGTDGDGVGNSNGVIDRDEPLWTVNMDLTIFTLRPDHFARIFDHFTEIEVFEMLLR